MTTNGIFLPGRVEALAKAGLKWVNVSQDTFDPETFAEFTQSGAYDRVFEGSKLRWRPGWTQSS